MQRFTATLDTTAKMVTVTVCAVIIIPFIFIGEYFIATHDYRILIVPVLIILTFLFTALWRPLAYSLDAEGLHVHRMLGTKALGRPATAMRAGREELGFGIRTFGSGGAFGYLGRFRYHHIGPVMMYVTDRSKMVLITLQNGKKIIISPEHPDAFLAAFSAASAIKNPA